MSALQRQVADATLRRSKEEDEASGRRGYPWPAEAWKKAEEAILNGTWKERRRPTHYPILLTTTGPISSASELQTLAGTESLPEVTEVVQVDMENQEIKKLGVFDVDEDEMDRMRAKAEMTPEIDIVVMFEGKRRFVWIVAGLKIDETSGDEDGEEDAKKDQEEDEDDTTASFKPKPGPDGESENRV
jgi:hypothetical protein